MNGDFVVEEEGIFDYKTGERLSPEEEAEAKAQSEKHRLIRRAECRRPHCSPSGVQIGSYGVSVARVRRLRLRRRMRGRTRRLALAFVPASRS